MVNDTPIDSFRQHGATVLVVEDAPLQREVVTTLLRGWGYSILEAGTACEALRLASSADLILLDVGLPDRDGYSVCRQLRKTPATARKPVLIVSGGLNRVEERVAGLDIGVDGFLGKPIHPEELRATVRSALRAHQAEEALHILERELTQARKLEAIGQLAGGIAHDFNNLLTVINGQLGEALEVLTTGGPARLRAMLQTALTAGQRAAIRTQQLLAFSRREVVSPRPLDLNALLRELWPVLENLLGETITLEDALSPVLPAVRADPDRLDSVVLNLVVNARDACSDGRAGGRVTLATRPGKDPRWVELEVRDTGAGMTAEVRARVFEPFFTTKGRHGTGLGLAMVFGTVQVHEGEIDVESEPGRGSTFRIRLPRAETAARGRVERAERAGVGDTPGGTEVVLVVDDDESVRSYTSTALRSLGYTVLEAESGEAALAYRDMPIDALMTDVVMPGMSASELALRMTRDRPGLRVLFVSGMPEGMMGVGAGEVAFLAKPFSLRQMAEAIRRLLDSGAGEGSGVG